MKVKHAYIISLSDDHILNFTDTFVDVNDMSIPGKLGNFIFRCKTIVPAKMKAFLGTKKSRFGNCILAREV